MTVKTKVSLEEQIAYHVKEILRLLGENPDREGLVETPMRVARALLEMTSALRTEAPPMKVFRISEEGRHSSEGELVLVKNITVSTLCEHHLLPVIGKIHLAYVVGEEGKVAGFSKIIRLVNYFASKPQLQERLAAEIADAFMNSDVRPKGVMVVIHALHMCSYVRGVKDKEASLVSIVTRGVFDTDKSLKNQVLRLINVGDKKNLV